MNTKGGAGHLMHGMLTVSQWTLEAKRLLRTSSHPTFLVETLCISLRFMMVTGIEVAGLVLGSLPLIISAMEHYAEGVRTMQHFSKYQRELKSVIRDLETENVILRTFTESLLQGLVSPEDMETLMTDCGGELWKTPELKDNLKAILSGSYKVYVETMADIHTAVQDLRKSLGIGPDGNAAWAKSGRRNMWRRARFSLNRTAHQEVLTKIKAGNVQLLTLTQQRNILEAPRRRTNRRYDRDLFERVRKTADDLYQSLASSLACACSEKHSVNLELQHRVGSPLVHGESSSAHEPIQFTFLLSLKHSLNVPETGGSTLLWKELRFQKEPLAIPSGLANNPPRVPSTAIPKPPLRRKMKFKSVKFLTNVDVFEKSGKSTTIGTVQSTITQTNPIGYGISALAMNSLSIGVSSPGSESSPARISSLCSALQQHNTSSPVGMCIGILPSQTKNYRLVGMQTASDQKDWSIVPLGSILGGQSNIMPEYCWADRLTTAVILASSALQLSESSWLSPNWTKNDLVFAHGKHQNSYKQVFISRQFQTARTGPSDNTTISDDPMPYIRNVAIFTLGLLLIELCFGKSIEQLRGASDPLPANGRPNGLTRFSIAKRLLDGREIFQRRGARYEKAVRRCIFCDFDQQNNTLEDEGFRRAVDENVVALLEEDLRAFHDVN